MVKQFQRCCGILMILLLLTVSSSLAQDDLQETRFLMTFVPNIQFSPLYVAQANGYFADAGYELTVEYLNEPDVIDLVAAEQAQFGVVSGEQVILAASQGRPVVYVYEWFQQYPVGVVVPAASAIETVTDLTDLRVGIPGRFGASYSGFTTLLLSAEMTENNVLLEEIGFSAPEVFCIGAIDASVVYVNNEPLQIRNRAQQGDCGEVEDVRVLTVAAEADLVSNGIVTSQMMLESDPEQVQAIVAAYDAGLRDVIQNPAQAYLLSADYVENLPLSDDLAAALTDLAAEQADFLAATPDVDRDTLAATRSDMLASLLDADIPSDELIQFEVLLASIELWEADQTGFSDAESWETMQTTLLEMGALESEQVVVTLFTNDYLPETANE